MHAAQVCPSNLQRSVGEAAADICEGLEEEVVDPCTGYSLDLACCASRLAIEVDGPSHYQFRIGGSDRVPNGTTLLKRRLLAAAGWRVVSVPFYEWDALEGRTERGAYLQRQLYG